MLRILWEVSEGVALHKMKYIQGVAHVVRIYTLVFYSVGSTKKTRRLELQ